VTERSDFGSDRSGGAEFADRIGQLDVASRFVAGLEGWIVSEGVMIRS
jgi:hypothetical protein